MISKGIHILTTADLKAIEQHSFARGVERGRFEERSRVEHDVINEKTGGLSDTQIQELLADEPADRSDPEGGIPGRVPAASVPTVVLKRKQWPEFKPEIDRRESIDTSN